jgi:hypothetical protein
MRGLGMMLNFAAAGAPAEVSQKELTRNCLLHAEFQQEDRRAEEGES